MVTQVNARAGAFLDGVQVTANDLRLQLADASLTATAAAGSTGIAATQGVRPGQGNPLLSTWTSGMAFTLNAGTCYVVGTASGTAGVYTATLDTTTTLTVPNGDVANPRIDSVIAVVSDVGTSSSTTIFKILPGTPAGSPVAPTLPANALRLANIAVATNATVLSAPNFTDLRVYTVASGGILPVASSAGTQNGPAGAYEDDLATGRLKRLDGSGNARAPKVAAFAPVTATVSSDVTANPSVTATIASVSVTTDGVTEIDVRVSFAGVYQNTPTVTDWGTLALQLDGTPWTGSAWFVATPNTSGNAHSGGTFTSSVTPSAGTHTITWKLQTAASSSNSISVYAAAINATLRVSAAGG